MNESQINCQAFQETYTGNELKNLIKFFVRSKVMFILLTFVGMV